MSAQWPLLIVALLTGVGGWLLAAACGHVLAGGAGARVRPRTPHVVALLAVVVLMVAAVVVQGVALGRASALFQLLARPGSSTFAPGVATIACLVLAVAVVVAGRRGVGDAPMRVLAALGCVAGVALAVTGAASFLPSSFPAWNTPLLPVYYLANTVFMGGLTALVIAGLTNDDSAKDLGVKVALAGGALQLIAVFTYAFIINGSAGLYSADIQYYFDPTLPDVAMVDRASIVGSIFAGANAVMFWLGAVAVGLVAPLVLTWLAKKVETGKKLAAYAGVALACVAVGGLCWRVILYVVAISIFALY